MSISTATPTVEDFEPFRRELTGYCYRMLGSGFEAEDAVQDTFVKAWRAIDDFEGRSSVRSWLYRIATNVCIDMQRSVQRRARPMDLERSSPPDERFLAPPNHEVLWITPIDDAKVAPESADPAEVASYRESIRLAFVTALQHLPARQRAALLLCEVLRWPVVEAAELLDTTVPAVNSALQRARATLGERPDQSHQAPLDDDDAILLDRYADAFERYDIAELVSLLRADAIQSMPPFSLWIQGAEQIGEWMVQPGPSGCRGSRLVPMRANGCPGFAQYRPDPDGGFVPWGLHILEISDGEVTSINTFLAMLDPEGLFPSFGLPNHLDA
jgi:RNA polymerase sigma-70 factor (ECF subfamily)